MKHLFTTFFLIGMSMMVCSQDYYWYRGTKVPLERGCRKYIIYENDKLSESDKSHITHSEDVFYDEIPNLKWGTTTAHAIIEDTAHVHYSIISYRKDGDYYDNMCVTHRFFVKLKNQNNLPLLQELADRYSVEIEHKTALENEDGVFPPWYILRCKLDAPKNALELANLFYETTDLFSAIEPEMINIFLPEFPKAFKNLCDEWNVWYESFMSFGPVNDSRVLKYRLATDTMINNQHYAQLTYNVLYEPYVGALREGSNRDIYYIPPGSTHEYLLYAFNAQVGDTITNLYVGAMGKEEGYQAVVRAISDSNPRIFTVGVNIDEYTEYSIKWIEGVGSPETPYGLAVVPTVPADPGVYSLLCAYKNGEQVYVSEWGEQYGCEFQYREDFIEGEFVTLYGNIVASFRECSIDGCPRCFGTFMTQDASFYLLTATDTLIMEQLNMLYLGKQYTIKGVWTKCKNTPFIEVNAIYETKDTIPSDTIPLYIKDGPGSSTVEPVDPNEIIAKLIHDELQIKEYLHTIIDYNLTKAPAANSSPAVKHVNPVVAADSFTDSETVTLTESGRYFLEMSHPDWDYTIVGTFVYNALQGLETIENSQSACTKELREGQLLIRQGEQLYTPTGIRIQ